MANNQYVNKVVYGNQTVIDISDSDAQESDVANGKIFYKGNGQRSTGNYTPPTLINLNPSNSFPPAIISGNDYHATGAGYAIQTFESKIIRSTPTPIDVGKIYQISSESLYPDGYIIHSYSSKTPDDSNPPSVSSGEIVRVGSSGYLYKTQQSVPIYTNFTTTTINVYNQSGHKWTYTFNPNKLYTLSMSGQSAYASKRYLIQNGERTIITDNSGTGVTVTWNAATSTITVTTTLAYTATLITIE